MVIPGPIGSYAIGEAGVAVLPAGGGTVRWYPEVEVFPGARPPADTQMKGIGIGGTFTCALLLDGQVECFGTNSIGLPYAQPAEPGPYVSVHSAGPMTCALKASGEPYCWSSHIYMAQHPEMAAPAEERFVKLQAGHFNSCGLRADGTVRCWGSCCGRIGEWDY